MWTTAAPSTDFDELPDPTRRAISMGLGLFPMLPLLPGCGAGTDDAVRPAPSTQDQTTPAAETASSPVQVPARTPATTPASVSGVFRHPGLLVTEDDFTRIRELIKTGQQPWTDWFNKLCADKFSILETQPYPVAGAYRQDGSKNALYVDIWRAWSLVLRWKLSGDNRYADKVVEFLDAWSGTLKAVGTVAPGSTAPDDHTGVILAGIQGHQFAQIGEILRSYPGWAPENLKRFQDMLMTVFAPISSMFLRQGHIGSHANWDMASMVGAMAIGIFCDNAELYRLACDCYAANNNGKLTSFGNGAIQHGVYYMHPGHFGQWEESGRDQGHSTLGMSLGGDVMEMAWNQGDDLYGLYNNRFLSAAEYVARSNLQDANGNLYPMPYVPEHNPTQPHTSLWTDIARGVPGHGRNCWEPIFNHYVNRLGIAAPNVARMVPYCEAKYGGSSDDIWWPTLIHRRPDYAGPMKAPSGLTVTLRDGQILLSWWGSVGATSYVVQRSQSANGPYADLATVASTDLLTYTDTPSADVWFYRVTAAAANGTRATGSAVRAVKPGEQRLIMPLNGLNNTGTSGTLLTPAGVQTSIEGTLINGATWGAGRLASEQALMFDLNTEGSGLQLPSGIFRDLDDFTVSLWAFANAPVVWESTLLFAGTDGNSFLSISPRSRAGMRFAICGATSPNDDQTVGVPSMPIRRWVHVAFTLRGNTGRLYIDGSEVAMSDGIRLSPRQVGDQVTFIGRGWNVPPFNGRIQDFRVYVGALDATEVAALAK